MKKVITLFIANVLTVVGFVALLEIGVRVFVPEIGPIGTEKTLINDFSFNSRGGLAKNAKGYNNGVLVYTDERRTIKYDKPYDPALNSVLFVGDSVTMGLGVEPDSTFAGLLATRVDSVNILNTALIGYNATDYEAVVDSFLNFRSPLKDERKKIERVMIFWCLNDVYRDVPISTIPGALTRKIGAGVLPFIRRHLRLYQFLKAALFDRSRSYYEHDAFYYARVGTYYQYALEKMGIIQELCKEQGVDLQVVLLPYEFQLRDHPEKELMNAPQELFKIDLGAMGITVLDGLEFMRNWPDDSEELFLFGDGIHFSKTGHRAFAAYVQAEVL